MMKLNKYHIRRLLWGFLLTGSMAVAGGPEYFGLTLNINTKDDVVKTLTARHARFNDNFGYHGYGTDLPAIKVFSDPLLNQQGVIDEAWLEFTPAKKLYRISVTWRDAGDTYTLIKDVFDEKYHLQRQSGQGFVTKYIYEKGDTRITLTRNTFGFGENQTTKIEYVHEPSLKVVNAMKRKIDAQIKADNIKRKGQNL